MSKSKPIDIKYPKKKYIINENYDSLKVINESIDNESIDNESMEESFNEEMGNDFQFDYKNEFDSTLKKSLSNQNLNFSICFDNKFQKKELNDSFDKLLFDKQKFDKQKFDNQILNKQMLNNQKIDKQKLDEESKYLTSILSCTPPEKDFLLTKLNSIYPKSDGKWVNSSLVLSCQTCMSKFGLFNRKHHCRACGGVFCSKCCYKTIEIPKDFIQKPVEDDTYKQKISNMTNWLLKGKDSLVCNDCYRKIKNLNQITWIIQICEFLDFKSLNRVLGISSSWHKAGIHQLSKFREIQYKYSELFTNWEQIIIWT